jgi:hypothetical protein
MEDIKKDIEETWQKVGALMPHLYQRGEKLDTLHVSVEKLVDDTRVLRVGAERINTPTMRWRIGLFLVAALCLTVVWYISQREFTSVLKTE